MDADECRVRRQALEELRANPERYLASYTARFGNLLNADDAATLFEEYNRDPVKYRVAVHPAATWIRDELFGRALLVTDPREERNRVAFTAGSNAAGKSTALTFTREQARAQVVFDFTFSNPEHAGRLVDSVLAVFKPITILYVNRPLEDAFRGMLERAAQQGRVVRISQLIGSHQGAVQTMRLLWGKYQDDPRFEFRFVDNSSGSPRLGTIELAVPQEYTGIGQRLHELLDREYQAGRITEAAYRRIRGS